MKLCFVSNNKNKLLEVSSILKNIEIISLEDIGFNEEILETGSSLKENSQLNLFLEECNLKEKNQELILIRNTIVKNQAKQVNIINQSLESIFEKLSPQGNPYPSPLPLKSK